MKTGRKICLLLLLLNDVHGLLNDLRSGGAATSQLIKSAYNAKPVDVADGLRTSAMELSNGPQTVDGLSSARNGKLAEANSIIPTEKEAGNSVGKNEEYCAQPGLKKRSLVLVRRGCFHPLASMMGSTSRGFGRMSEKLGDASKRLTDFADLPFSKQLEWFAKRTRNGAVKTSNTLVVNPLRAMGGLMLRMWRRVGEGVHKTGSTLQHIGERMREQAEARLAKGPSTAASYKSYDTGPASYMHPPYHMNAPPPPYNMNAPPPYQMNTPAHLLPMDHPTGSSTAFGRESPPPTSGPSPPDHPTSSPTASGRDPPTAS
ncbi:hypothetical protein PCASD_12506 [Puccinia coronata f. sp. avenae]|uniref:Uncharacterized protein n=1 Tax=Puccinia coronata f. sp. avenae TaxID=200324 RepID=A0A2N5U7N1_9BASI|nr:hypothetical protein PCASD_12506 [Puccinia coronata f. sp. avenae]